MSTSSFTRGEFIVQSQMDGTNYGKSTAHYKTKYNCFFLNCHLALGCTICITGPNQEELEDLKKCIKAILDACRNELLGNGFEKEIILSSAEQEYIITTISVLGIRQ